MSTFTVEIYSRGYEIGVGKITKEQYDYWIEREDDLDSALQQNMDYEDEGVPVEAQFEYYYNEYSSEAEAYGADATYSTLVIKQDQTELFNGELAEFLDEDRGTEENMECSSFLDLDDLGPGYYVYWEMGGKGMYFEGQFEADEFKPELLTFKYTEINGREVLTTVEYNGVEIDNHGGDYWGKYSDFSLHYVEQYEEE